jgi:hypothetical protein
VWGGGGTRWRPKPSTPSSSCGFRVNPQTHHMEVGSKVAERPYMQSRDNARIWCKTAISLLIPQQRIFARNLFNNIDTEASYLAYTSVKIHLPPSCELGNQIHALNGKHALYKLWGRGRTPLVGVTSFQRQHLC